MWHMPQSVSLLFGKELITGQAGAAPLALHLMDYVKDHSCFYSLSQSILVLEAGGGKNHRGRHILTQDCGYDSNREVKYERRLNFNKSIESKTVKCP